MISRRMIYINRNADSVLFNYKFIIDMALLRISDGVCYLKVWSQCVLKIFVTGLKAIQFVHRFDSYVLHCNIKINHGTLLILFMPNLSVR